MTTAELKTSIIDEINKTEDLEQLETLKEFIECLKSEAPVLSEWQLKRIEESDRQFQEGKIISREDADLKIEKWLKK